MLQATFESHPLLKIILPENPDPHYLFGLHENFVRFLSDNSLFFVGVNELRKVFKHLCENNNFTAIQSFFDFDYQELISLDKEDPFCLSSHPFEFQFILQQIFQLNYLSDFSSPTGIKQELFLTLFEHVKNEVMSKINSEKDLLSNSFLDVMYAVCVYQPELVYSNKLFQELEGNFVLTQEIYENSSYKDLLIVLEGMARGNNLDFFQFSAIRLLKLAAEEVKLGIYRGGHRAIHSLIDLFRNACAPTAVSLEQRKMYLENFLHEAKNPRDYSKLYVLMRVLGVGADVFESGEYTYLEEGFYESYINFCIEALSAYAGQKDEDNLSFRAENELHHLLKNTIDEPEIWGASEVPFRILRLFFESNRAWDLSPMYAVDRLDNIIKDLQTEIRKKTIENNNNIFSEEIAELQKSVDELELRFQQFISFGKKREFLSDDFTLVLGSKNPKKEDCVLDDPTDVASGLSLHERQSLVEGLIFAGKSNIHDTKERWWRPRVTYVVANLGFVFARHTDNKEAKTEEPFKRRFRTLPIKVPNYTITGRKYSYGGHAEEAFYNYMLQDINITHYLTQFKNQFGLVGADHKIYAVVLDLHGTYDMCLSCSEIGLDFQDKFRIKLLAHFQAHNLISLRKYPTQLPVIIRYSSDLEFGYADTELKKKGTLLTLRQEGKKRDLSQVSLSIPVQPFNLFPHRNIKNYGPNLLVHGKENWHLLWTKSKKDEHTDKELIVEQATAFTTDYQINHMSEARAQQPYSSPEGKIETHVPRGPTSSG